MKAVINLYQGKILYIFLCIFFLCCHSTAQPGYDILFNKNYADRSVSFDTLVLERSWQYDSVAFGQLMDKLDQRAKKAGDYGMQLEIILGRYWRTDIENTTNFDAKIAPYGAIDRGDKCKEIS